MGRFLTPKRGRRLRIDRASLLTLSRCPRLTHHFIPVRSDIAAIRKCRGGSYEVSPHADIQLTYAVERADERTRTADLISLRVSKRWSRRVRAGPITRISKRFSHIPYGPGLARMRLHWHTL